MTEMPFEQHGAGSERTTGILVAGMHRSGTSALTRALNVLGCGLPATIMPAGPGNEAGHWESEPVAALNEEVLAAAGSSWADWRPLDLDQLWVETADAIRARALSVLEHEVGGHDLFVLKDPRICRMLDFWIDALKAFGARPVVVLPIRSPLDVAASLMARDGLSLEQGHAIWLRHVLDAEASSRDMDRVFVSYDDLVADWRAETGRIAHALGIALRQPPEAATEAVADVVSPALRHHCAKGDRVPEAGMGHWVADAFDVFARWSRDDVHADDTDTLEAVRTAFDAATPAFSSLVAALEDRIRALERECLESRRRIETLEAENRERSRQIEHMTNSVSWRITEPLRRIGQR